MNTKESIEGMCVFDSEIISWNLGSKKIWSSRANFRKREFSSEDLKILPLAQIFIGKKGTQSDITALVNVSCFPEENVFVVVVNVTQQPGDIRLKRYAVIRSDQTDDLQKMVYKTGEINGWFDEMFISAEQKVVTLAWKDPASKFEDAQGEWVVR